MSLEENHLEQLFSDARQFPVLEREEERAIDASKWQAVEAMQQCLAKDPAGRRLLADVADRCRHSPPRVEQFDRREQYFLLRSEIAPYLHEGKRCKEMDRLAHLLYAGAAPRSIVEQLATLALPAPLVTGLARIAANRGCQRGRAAALLSWMAAWAPPAASLTGYRSDDARTLRGLIRDYTNAREKLVAHNLRLVFSIAGKYTGDGITYADLVQEGSLGLMRAAEKFDHRTGYRFSTYSFNWISQAVRRYAADQSGVIRYPAHVREQVNRLYATLEEETRRMGVQPSHQALAERLELEPEQLHQLRQLRNRGYSLDAPPEPANFDTSHGWHERLAGGPFMPATAASEQDAMHRSLLAAIDELDPPEQTVLIGRWGLHDHRRVLSRAELAEQLQVSREWVRQLEASALKKLRGSQQLQDLL